MSKTTPTTDRGSPVRRRIPVLLAALAAVMLSTLSTGVWADPTFVNAADPDLPNQARGVPKGGALTVFGLNLQGEGTVTLELERFSVFAEDAQLVLVTDTGETSLSAPNVAYFRGWANHDPNSIVTLSVSEDGSTHGVITGTNGAWMFDNNHPGKGVGLRNRKVDLESELGDRTFSCGEEAAPSGTSAGAPAAAEAGVTAAAGIPTNVQYTAHMIVDTDYEYLQRFGGDPVAALQYLGDVFAYSSGLYEREISTNLQISYARLFSTNNDPYTENNAGCGDDGGLDEVQAEWNGNTTPRTLVHLVSGKTAGQGCAFVGVLCSQGSGYGASLGIMQGKGGGWFDIDGPADVFWDNMVIAHEIGHNFDSPHTHNYCGYADIADPVDICVTQAEASDSCADPDPASLPGPGSLTGGSAGDGNGTIMSYCHARSGGFDNFSWTFGQYHPDGVAPFRVVDRMRAHVAASSSCMAVSYTGSDLAVYKDCKPDSPALVGDTGICTIVVENNGPEMALGVVTEDLFLSNGTFSFGTVTATKGDEPMAGDTCTTSANPQNQSGDVTCDLDHLDAGETVTIKVPVTADDPQNVNDRVSVASDSPDYDKTNNMAEDTLTFVEDADLAVTKDCKPDGDLLVGETGKCTIIVQNFGPSAAEAVKVVDTHSSNKAFTIDGVTPGAQCGIASDVVTCNFTSIDAGGSQTIVVSISEDEPMDINDTVTVTSATADSNTSNNQASDSLHIVDEADLQVQKICKPDGPAIAGETGKCEIFITNHGPSVARDAILVDEIFASGQYTVNYFADPGVICSQPDKDIDCSLGDMDAGDVIKVTVLTWANHPIDTWANTQIDINDLATATSETFDPDTANNSDEGSITFIKPVADLAVTKDCKPDGDLLVGEEGTCTIIVQNFGPQDAVNVHVVDTHISNKPFTIDGVVPGPATCNIASNVVTCDFASIAAGAAETIVVTIVENKPMDINDTVTVTADSTDPNTSNNEASDGLHIVEVSDLAVTKDCKPDGDLLAGEDGTCTIIVKNFGPAAANNVHVVDTHISNKPFTIDAVDPGPATCNIAANVVTCDFASIAKNATETIVVTINETEPMDINDTVTVDSDSADPDNNNNQASDGLHIVGLADLRVSKSGPPTVVAGTGLQYTLRVDNDGPSTAVNVVVEDLLPAGTSIAGLPPNCSAGIPGDPSKPTVCVIGTLAPAEFAEFPIFLDVLPGTTGVLKNTARVSSNTLDSNNFNNQFNSNTEVLVVTDLSDLAKSDNPDPVAAGAVLNYVITMSNQGPSTATNVVLHDTLPAETSLIKYKVLAGNAFSCVDSALELTCSIGTMEPGDSFTLTISVLVDPSTPDGDIVNCASVTEDSGPGYGLVCETTTVGPAADLWIDKTGSFITQNPSSNILYTLTVHNDSGCSVDDPQVCGEGGPSDAVNVVVTDTLPATNKKLVVVYVSENCLYDYPSHTVTCETPLLAAGDKVVHQIEVTPKGRLRAITNVADVDSDTFDPDYTNNLDEMTLSVGGGGQKSTGE